MEDRYEAVLIGMTLGEFNYGRFKNGTLTKEEKERYFHFLDKVKPRLEPLKIEQASSVSNMSAKIDLFKPDLVLVDGVYLMDDDRGADSDWLRVAHITRDIKNLCKQRKIPFVINTQADKSTSKKTGPELDNISYSQSVGQDSDVVLGLFRDEQMIEDKEAKLKVLKQREGVLSSIMMNWDFNRMNFDTIYTIGGQNEEEHKHDESKIVGEDENNSAVLGDNIE